MFQCLVTEYGKLDPCSYELLPALMKPYCWLCSNVLLTNMRNLITKHAGQNPLWKICNKLSSPMSLMITLLKPVCWIIFNILLPNMQNLILDHSSLLWWSHVVTYFERSLLFISQDAAHFVKFFQRKYGDTCKYF